MCVCMFDERGAAYEASGREGVGGGEVLIVVHVGGVAVHGVCVCVCMCVCVWWRE